MEESEDRTKFETPAGPSTNELGDLVATVVTKVLAELNAGNTYTTTKSTFKPGAVPKSRKSSLFRRGKDFLEAANGSPAEKIPSKEKIKDVNMVYPEREIKEEDKMHTLSLPSVMYFKKKVDALNATSIVEVKLQKYISNKVMEDIWNFENRKNTEFTWTSHFEDLFLLSHEQFMTLLARRLRPKTHDEYCKLMASCVPKFKNIPEKFTLASPDYDKVIFQQIANYFTVVSEVEEFIRHGITEDESEHLPEVELGKEDSRKGLGVFGISIALLGPKFAEDYKRLVGVDTLKACKTMDEFMEVVTKINHDLANKSERERNERLELQPKFTAKALSQLVDDVKTSAHEYSNRKTDSRPVNKRLFGVQDELEDPPEQILVPDTTPTVFAAEESLEAVYPDGDVGDIYFIKTYKDKPQEKVLPCYQHFDGRCTAGPTCAYSHDPTVLAAYAKEQLNRLLRSKYITPDDLLNAAKERASQPSRVPAAPKTQDARQLPAGRGPAQLRVLARPPEAEQRSDAPDDN
jgi:hypothetical protein